MDSNGNEGYPSALERMMFGGVIDVGLALDRRAAIINCIAQVAAGAAQILAKPPEDHKEGQEHFWRASLGKAFCIATALVIVPKHGPKDPNYYVAPKPTWIRGGMPAGVKVLVRYTFLGSTEPSIDIGVRKTLTIPVNAARAIKEEVIVINGKDIMPAIIGHENFDSIEWCELVLPVEG